MTVEARRESFTQSDRFTRIRAGFNQEHLNRILDDLVESGFYFAREVNVFDQIKCFHCDTTFSVDIFGITELTRDLVHRIHAHQNSCTFLINLVGAVQFQHLTRQPRYRVIPRAPVADPREANLIVHEGDIIPMIEDTDLDQNTARDVFQNVRQMMRCRICNTNRACVLFQPCNHLVTCPACQNGLTHCPRCTVAIANRYGAHFA